MLDIFDWHYTFLDLTLDTLTFDVFGHVVRGTFGLSEFDLLGHSVLWDSVF